MLKRLQELRRLREQEMQMYERGSQAWIIAYGEKMRIVGRIEQIEVYGN